MVDWPSSGPLHGAEFTLKVQDSKEIATGRDGQTKTPTELGGAFIPFLQGTELNYQ